MYEWSASHIDGIKFFKVTESDVERLIDTIDLENRYYQKYNGIRSHHSFLPNDGALEMHRVSSDDYYIEINLTNNKAYSMMILMCLNLECMQYPFMITNGILVIY